MSWCELWAVTKRLRKPARRAIGGALLMLLIGAALIYVRVQTHGAPIYRRVSQVPPMPVAVVFGAQGDILEDRVRAAADLYRAGKVRTLLLTGDNHSDDYDEPAEMRAMALADGVPARALVCDDAGFRTYDSVYRARAVFGVRRAVFVTQRYHLHRALYLGRSLGMDVVGLDAARRPYAGQTWFDLREFFAVETAWFDVTLHRRPKFLGPRLPLPTG